MISRMFFPSDIKHKKKSVINVARMCKETTSNDMIWNHCILILGFGFNYFFKCSLGEDEPILISIFFKWVGTKPPN